MPYDSLRTAGGVAVTREATPVLMPTALDSILDRIDTRRGGVFASSYEYPGRYKRWSMGFVDPCVEFIGTGQAFSLLALNERGEVVLEILADALHGLDALDQLTVGPQRIDGRVRQPQPGFAEEERSRQPSLFSVLRALMAHLATDQDAHLGFYGAFAFDLIYQFEPVAGLRPRPADHRDLVLYLPDQIVTVDHHAGSATRYSYEFENRSGRSTRGLPRHTPAVDPAGNRRLLEKEADLAPGAYADIVRDALDYFKRGDLFEVVPSHSLYAQSTASPRALFDTLRQINPSPYGFILNLDGEYLIGASPEMFVRVEGRRVETCPISGTIRRGRDALEDAERIRELLNSRKDEAELTMCTDVDRNDKARVCEPGSVRVIGRRQIELYSHLIHTVDHVEGMLRPDCDALDAFLTHCWAVTLTGAPKPAAIQFIEKHEVGFRRWYGGAVGRVTVDGNLNTGITLRTIRLKDTIAEVRAGATLLYDSIPEEEEAETLLKAAAMRKAIASVGQKAAPATAAPARPGAGRRVLMVDCEDSFVLTLGDYLRQTGATVTTLRHSVAWDALSKGDWDLVVLSPGPGRPEQFRVPEMVRLLAERRIPTFGVCLGMQAMVEAFGGRLDQLAVPMHGKPSPIVTEGNGALFDGLPDRFVVGRYHSLIADPAHLPGELQVLARTAEDGVIMALQHRDLPIAGVQFHPESIMTLGHEAGPVLIANVMRHLAKAA